MRLVVFLMLALLAACAHSPQQLSLMPDIELVGERYGRGQVVSVVTVDERASKVVGSLGGAYPGSSTITLAEGVEENLTRVVEAHLVTQGFNTGAAQESAAQFKLIIESLKYDVPKQWLGKTVVLKAGMKVEVSFGREIYTGNYLTEQKHVLPVTPSLEKNEELVSSVVSQTLSRVFQDKKLQAFMSNL